MGETTPAGVKELRYATFGAGQVAWQREGELLLITVREPVWAARRVNWWRVVGAWAGVALAVMIGVRVMGGADAMPKAFRIIFMMVVAVGVLRVVGGLSGSRTLSVRVSAKKLLIDESSPRRRMIVDGLYLSVDGRAWEKAEIVSVKANGGSLNVKTKTRRLASLSISGYDPGDMAWLAEVIGKVLEGGAVAWERSQRG